MDNTKIYSDDGRWMKLALDHAQWLALVLEVTITKKKKKKYLGH
jgi:hypothetical protein